MAGRMRGGNEHGEEGAWGPQRRCRFSRTSSSGEERREEGRSGWVDAEEVEQVWVVPAGILLLATDAAFFRRVALEQVECQAPQGGEVLRGIAGAGSMRIPGQGYQSFRRKV